MVIRDWVLAFLILGLGVTLLGVAGVTGAWTFLLIALFIVLGGAMLVLDDWRGRHPRNDQKHNLA